MTSPTAGHGLPVTRGVDAVRSGRHVLNRGKGVSLRERGTEDGLDCLVGGEHAVQCWGGETGLARTGIHRNYYSAVKIDDIKQHR